MNREQWVSVLLGLAATAADLIWAGLQLGHRDRA